MELIEIQRYGNRNWAVYFAGELLAVTVYKKGAKAVAAKIEELMTGASGGSRGKMPTSEECSCERIKIRKEGNPSSLRLFGAA